MSRDNKNSGAGAQRKVLGGAFLLSLNYSGKTQDKKYDINSNPHSQRG